MTSQTHFSLEALAALTNSQLIGNPSHVITGVADLESATELDASFLSNPRYNQAMKKSKAGVIFISPQNSLMDGKNYLISEDPSRAFQQFVDTLHPPSQFRSGFHGIHPTAVIHKSALLGNEISIGPHAVIEEGVIIGERTFVGAGSYIGAKSIVGKECYIHPRVVIRERCQIGNQVIIQPGAVIGSCGFGYTTDKQGRHLKLNQVGNVVIEDDVEIGANTTIDRARFKETRIGKGTKIDNLVQIGHGVVLGSYNMIVAQTGIAGSSSTGRYVVLAGQVAVAGHLHLADYVTVAGKSGVTKSLPSGKFGGIPAVPLYEYNRNQVYLRHIEKYAEQLKALAAQVAILASDCRR